MAGPPDPPPDLSVEAMVRLLFPLPKDDLPEDQRAKVMAEINAGQPARYLGLINALDHAGRVARQTGWEDGGRKAAIYALTFIVLYFRDAPGFAAYLAPIKNLAGALADLEAGRAVHPMLKAPGSAMLTHDRAEVHGTIAAWAHLLGAAGMNQGAADALVAEKIDALGYRKRGERQGAATARTVAEWRGEAVQPDARGVDPASFQRIVRIYGEGPAEERTPQRLNDDLPRLLLSMWPHLFRLPTKPPSFSGK